MYSCKSPTMMQQPELDLATRSRQHGRVAAALPVQVNNPGARIRPRGLKEAMKETRWHKSFRFMLKFSCSSCLRGGLGGGGAGRQGNQPQHTAGCRGSIGFASETWRPKRRGK